VLPAPHGPTTLAEALRRLDAAGLALSGLVLRRPTLDDVFLALTGQPDKERATLP
jgi:ABC-2 type transport system ATP-binding protein